MYPRFGSPISAASKVNAPSAPGHCSRARRARVHRRTTAPRPETARLPPPAVRVRWPAIRRPLALQGVTRQAHRRQLTAQQRDPFRGQTGVTGQQRCGACAGQPPADDRDVEASRHDCSGSARESRGRESPKPQLRRDIACLAAGLRSNSSSPRSRTAITDWRCRRTISPDDP